MQKKKQLILIILILGTGSILGTVYASGTIITNTSVTTTTLNAVNLVLSGTCTGCGGGEGSFTTYSTILNTTVTGTTRSAASNLLVSDNGTVFGLDVGHVASLITINGIVQQQISSIDNMATIHGYQNIAQSPTGKYKAILDDAIPLIHVYKNDIPLLNLGFNSTQFFTGGADTPAIAISSNGKYIAFWAENADTNTVRLIVFQGS